MTVHVVNPEPASGIEDLADRSYLAANAQIADELKLDLVVGAGSGAANVDGERDGVISGFVFPIAARNDQNATSFYYDRLHFVRNGKLENDYGENEIHVPSVAVGIEYKFSLFNAFDEGMTVTDLQFSDGALTVTGLVIGDYMPPRAEISLFIIPALGIVNFSTLVTWSFDNGMTASARIIGLAALPITTIPQAPYMEALTFITEVQRTLDGTEQRIAARSIPRRSYDMTFLTGGEGDGYGIFKTLSSGSHRVFQIPISGERAKCTERPVIGESVVKVDTRYSSFVVDGHAILIDAYGVSEPIGINSYTDSEIITNAPITVQFRGSVYAVPMAAAYLTKRREAQNVHKRRDAIRV